MTEFETGALLELEVSQQSLREARATIEDDLGDVEVDVSATAADDVSGGGSRIAGRERAMSRQLSNNQLSVLQEIDDRGEDMHTLAIERNELLADLVDEMESGNRASARSGGGGLGGVGLALGGVTLAAGLGSVLSDFSWPDLPEWEWPPLPPLEWPDPPDLEVEKPGWVPIPVESPGGTGGGAPTEDVPRDRTPLPEQPTGIPNDIVDDDPTTGPSGIPVPLDETDDAPSSDPSPAPSPDPGLTDRLRNVVENTPEGAVAGGAAVAGAAGAGALARQGARAGGGAAAGGSSGLGVPIMPAVLGRDQGIQDWLAEQVGRGDQSRMAMTGRTPTGTRTESISTNSAADSKRQQSSEVNYSPTFNLDTKELERQQQRGMERLERRVEQLERGFGGR